MNSVINFLTALGQALATMSLYGDEHPMRHTVLARTHAAMLRMLADQGTMKLSLIDGDIVLGTRVVTELRAWEWSARLAAVGIQRIEIDAAQPPNGVDLQNFLAALRVRLVMLGKMAPAWSCQGIRIGALAVATGDADVTESMASVVESLSLTQLELEEETEAVGYVHDEVSAGRAVPMAEVEAIVHGLAVTIHREQHLVLPLLDLKTFDQYTTTHSCNVSMLSIGLSEELGMSASQVRAIGTAALLHDIGKVKIPLEVLIKPGKLTDEEFAYMKAHPVEGAKILSQRGGGNALASTVAYEHHIWFNGQGGYPSVNFRREAHFASRIVHVCDIYDALCSKRPYRDAWSQERALNLLRGLQSTELDPAIYPAFERMVQRAVSARVAYDPQELAGASAAPIAAIAAAAASAASSPVTAPAATVPDLGASVPAFEPPSTDE
ncbi:MAG: HD domain-containing protein [Gemmatimonadaceae bacterium]|nr:HD domain-containing protein [Gemmatimonadaceae bacterium]